MVYHVIANANEEETVGFVPVDKFYESDGVVIYNPGTANAVVTIIDAIVDQNGAVIKNTKFSVVVPAGQVYENRISYRFAGTIVAISTQKGVEISLPLTEV